MDTADGLSEQLDATSRMIYQIKLVLVMHWQNQEGCVG